MESLRSSVGQSLLGVAEYLTPALRTSQFLEKGVLTPEEFVAAGDQLVQKCPTWQWSSGDPSRTKSHLPSDKQFLVTRSVSCIARANTLADACAKETQVEEDEDGGWLATDSVNGEVGGKSLRGDEDEYGDIPAMGDSEGQALPESRIDLSAEVAAGPVVGEEDEDDIPDMDDFEEDNLLAENEAGDVVVNTSSYIVRSEPDDNLLATRTYDVSITYDKYYQTPRMWLLGYDESHDVLKPEEIAEDISSEHANKTVTFEQHPHSDVYQASIHPCKHASVMKIMLDRMQTASDGSKADGAGAESPVMQVEQYLFLFLKFINAVIPTIDYDQTTAIDALAN